MDTLNSNNHDIQVLVRLSRLPLISHVLQWGYTVFARNRLRLTGRCKSNRCEGSWFPRPARP